MHTSRRGFWYDYPNINRLMSTLNIPESSVFTGECINFAHSL
jgi:hypothetical protein